MRFIDLKLFLLLFGCVGGAVLYQSPARFRTLVETRETWDIAVMGQGYLQVTKEFEKEVYYTRRGKLTVNPNGQLCLNHNGQEWLIEPMLTVPGDWTEIYIAGDGAVSVLQPGTSSTLMIGQLQLAKFQAQPVFADDFAVNAASLEKHGTPTSATPGTNGTGQILQGWLEQPAESATHRYAKPIVIGSVIAIVLKVLLDAVLAQQKMQQLLQAKQPPVGLQ